MTISPSESLAIGKPRRRWERWFGYAAIGLLVALFARILVVRSFDNGPMPPALSIAGKIPVTLPNGKQGSLGDLIKPGLPTVITLWASWCGPCHLEAPAVVELRRRFGSDKLNLVYLNVREDGASRGNLAQYMTSVGLPPDAYAVLDSQNLGKLTNDRQNLIPRTYVFDHIGTPEAMIVGYKPLALARFADLIGAS